MTTSQPNSEMRSEINVTPLIDVLLVLLIIFMVITPLTPTGLQAAVPQPAPWQDGSREPNIVLEFLADGQLRLNAHPLVFSSLHTQISQLFASRANKVLFLKADQHLEYRQVALLIDAVKGANPAIQIGLLTPGTVVR